MIIQLKYKSAILLILLLAFSAGAFSQEEYYRVYQYETPYKGHLEVTNWTSYVANSSKGEDYKHYGTSYTRDKLIASSMELEYGVTDHFVLAGYADFDDPQMGHFNYARSRVEARYRFGERFENFINTMIYAEYYLPDHSYSNSQEFEARLIMDKDIEDFRIVANPMLSKYVNGDEDQSWQPSINAGIYYRRGKVIQPGVEYYENFHDHSASLFPTLDVYIGGSVMWNIGAGFGMNDPADKLIVKSILQVDLQAIRPSHLMRKKYSAADKM